MRRPAPRMDEHLLFEQRSHPIDVWSFANALSYCFIQRSTLTTCAQCVDAFGVEVSVLT